MKKFISFVMAAAMVASLVPATAFAKGEVTARAKVVDALNITKNEAQDKPYINEASWKDEVPELQLTITNTDYRNTQDGELPTLDVTLALDNATFAQKNTNSAPTGNDSAIRSQLHDLVTIYYDDDRGESESTTFEVDPLGGILFKAGKPQVTKPASPADDEANATDFLQWVLATFDVEVAIPAGVTDVWVDADGVLSVGNQADRTKIIEDGAFVSGYTSDDFVADYLSGVKDFVNADNAVASCKATLATASITAGSWSKAAAADWSGVTTTAAEKINVYTLNGYQVGKMVSVTNGGASKKGDITWVVKEYDDDEVTYTFTGKFAIDDVIVVDLCSLLDKRGEKRTATVSVESDAVTADDLVYVTIEGRGITATTRKIANVAEEEKVTMESDLKIKSTVGDFAGTAANGQVFELKLSKGFEFTKRLIDGADYEFHGRDGNVVYLLYKGADTDEITIDKDAIEIEATSAKAGSTCTMTVKALKDRDENNVSDSNRGTANATFAATATVELMKVVDYVVELSVDADEDVPVIYSGVNVANYGITDDSDHLSLEVTAEETFPGAWSFRKGFNFELPEHVYVTNVEVIEVDGFLRTPDTNKAEQDADLVTDDEMMEAFFNAYQDGSHVNFEFEKRVFDDVDSVLSKDVATVTFQLELVADPGFEGDVVLKLTGELVDEQEVTIAKFVKPYEVKAEQNDIIIDYRYTDIPTAITITEAEAGLWAKNEAEFYFSVEKATNGGTFMSFEDDPTFEIDSNSDLEIKDDKVNNSGAIQFKVDAESDEAATVTIKDMQLFMNRSIPAGPYDLSIGSSLARYYEAQVLFAPDEISSYNEATYDAQVDALDTLSGNHPSDCSTHGAKEDTYVGCVCDYSDTVKEAFINVITAGRDVDDASFTTKVVVPVGENYLVAGENQIELDVPAYINAAGYTMLPIRAVAKALGISNNNVLWDQPTKTVTILYGQRIITMTQGQKVVYVNGSAIPASAAVENTNSRTFLPMRDLATALGVTDIQWDQATRTATLNGNQK